jgi:hypothetical protein
MSTGRSLAAFKSAGLPAVDMGQFRQAAVNARQTLAAASQQNTLLRMGRDGLWIYGVDDVDVQDGSLWAINPFSIAMGFVAWGAQTGPDGKPGPNKGKLLGERMALITDPQPDLATLPVIPDLPTSSAEWKAQAAFDILCLNGEDAGVQLHYKVTSVGGVRAVEGLLAQVIKQIDAGGDCIPVVQLASDSYDHKTWGKIYVPVFDVVEWKARDATTLDSAEPGDEQAADAGDPDGEQPTEPQQEPGEPEQGEPDQAPARSQSRNARRAPVATGAQKAAPTGRRPAVAAGEVTAKTKATPPVERGGHVVRRRRK